MSKNVLIGALVVVIIILAVILLIPKGQNDDNSSVVYTPSPIASQPVISAAPSPTPIISPKVTKSPTSSITVLSPNGGEVFVLGGIMDITWKAPSSLQQVEIAIAQNCPKGVSLCPENFYQVFKVGNTGSFSWQISSNIPVGKYYTVAVADEFAMNSRYSDSSNGYIEIKKSESTLLPGPFVFAIVSPEKGNFYTTGDPVTIKIISESLAVKAELYLYRGNVLLEKIGEVQTTGGGSFSSGEFIWKIPFGMSPVQDYRIEARHNSAYHVPKSAFSGYFGIVL